jgi:regulation of enolase protein 1 (concanavalin A-like superfamily)
MRLANRVMAALLSLAVACAGVLLIIEVIAARTGHRTVVVNWRAAYDWAGRTAWISDSIRVTAAILIAAGLVLLIAELKPRRRSRLGVDPLKAGATDIDTAYTRRGVAVAIRSAVTGVDGVREASVKVTRRKIKIGATAAAREEAAARNLREPVMAAARQRLAALALRRPSALSVRVVSGSR